MGSASGVQAVVQTGVDLEAITWVVQMMILQSEAWYQYRRGDHLDQRKHDPPPPSGEMIFL